MFTDNEGIIMKKEKNNKMKLVGIGIICVLLIGTVLGYVGMYNLGQTNVGFVDDILDEVIPDDEIEVTEMWHVTDVYPAVGENDPGFETGGFMSIFWLDYAATVPEVLADNSTDWSNNVTVHAYEDTDAQTTDTVSEDPSYIVVRACFNQTQAGSGGVFNGSRCRVTLTCSGDETISQTIQGNHTDETYGGGIESENSTDAPLLYINFYFDDNSDGYRITDDGSVTWSVKIEAKW